MGVHQVRENWGEDRRTLFIGSASECVRVAEQIFSICQGWAGDEWKSVSTQVVRFDRAANVAVGGFAWFPIYDDGSYIWGEVLEIEDNVVLMDECYRIGSDDIEEFGSGLWAMDLTKCSGVI